ncbi:Imm50 family immunity protein, partial [Stenotrophomonas sp.]|uniref:Imm50 family immunity protein n=1 Tax=Stenotrophomonas sp. TaxID=69392 RepID=UPI002FC7B956
EAVRTKRLTTVYKTLGDSLQEFNTCQIGLRFLKTNNLKIQYKHTKEPLIATIKKEKNQYEIIIKNDKCQILIEAEYIALNGPTVYLNGTE